MLRKIQTLNKQALSKTEELKFVIQIQPDSRSRIRLLELATEVVDTTRILVAENRKLENLIDKLNRHIRYFGVLTLEIKKFK